MENKDDIRILVKATIDDLNQYLEGNVTRLGLILSLQELVEEL
jgi:hypothetical protein